MSEIGRWLEEERQREELARAIILGLLIEDILLYQPPKCAHWWQFWRAKP